MKFKPVIVICLIIGTFAFSSCCATKKVTQVETPALYELSLHQIYLKTEKRYLKMKIDTLEEGSDTYHTTKIALDSVQGNLTEIADLLSETPDKLIGPNGNEIFVEVKPIPIGPIGPDGPIPVPNPSPCHCTIPLSDLVVIVPEGLEHFDLHIKNAQNEVIGGLSKTTEKLFSEQQDLQFTVYQLNIPDNLKGQVIIEVTKYSNITRRMLTYRFRSELPKK